MTANRIVSLRVAIVPRRPMALDGAVHELLAPEVAVRCHAEMLGDVTWASRLKRINRSQGGSS